MDEIIITAEALKFAYEDGTQALNGVDLTIKKGTKVVLLGANGSGKSTFFLCLNGIHKPSSGQLSYQGRPFDYSRKGLLELRNKIGIVFQDPDNQLIMSNVKQEIAFGLLNTGMSQSEAEQRVNKSIGELEIADFSQKPTHALSGGQKKQVSVADILVMEPEVVILDEPAASLDPYHISLINQMIDGLTEKGTTVIISTHDVDFAYQWADDVVLFHQGKVLLQGKPKEVFSQVNMLNKTHLKQPTVLNMFYSLQKKGLLSLNEELPHDVKDLEQKIAKIPTPTYYGRTNLSKNEKVGILVVSFGTSHEDTRLKTIDVIREQIREKYPADQIFEAWTSGMIIKKVRSRDGYQIDTVKEAMEKIIAAGITKLIVQPTHVVNGIENDKMKADVLSYQDQLLAIQFGTPLLTCEEDSFLVIDALMEQFGVLEKDTALVFMGHGTTHFANTIYAALDYQFKDKGYPNVFVGTVEAYPSMETLQKLLREGNYKKLILTPFMIVAGDHAKNDMASDETDSWRCQFEQAGYQVSCIVRGLGEYEGIRSLLLSHLAQARLALEHKKTNEE